MFCVSGFALFSTTGKRFSVQLQGVVEHGQRARHALLQVLSFAVVFLEAFDPANHRRQQPTSVCTHTTQNRHKTGRVAPTAAKQPQQRMLRSVARWLMCHLLASFFCTLCLRLPRDWFSTSSRRSAAAAGKNNDG